MKPRIRDSVVYEPTVAKDLTKEARGGACYEIGIFATIAKKYEVLVNNLCDGKPINYRFIRKRGYLS